MNAAFLSKDVDSNAKEILNLLQDFEKKYPEQQDAFAKVARMRLVASEKAGRFADLEKETDNIFTRFKPDEQKELLVGLDKVLSKDVKKLEKQNDKEALLAAKRTLARLYADRLQRGTPFAEDESPQQFKYELAQIYLDVKDYDKAVPLYRELQQGAYSLVSLAGLAQIAEVKGDQRQSISYWEDMLKGTQVGDPLWFRGTFEVARLEAGLGDKENSCKTINGARPILTRLGEQGLKKKIQDLATQSCGK
jgi:tetratricopeptide (TPR) repeat protein